MDRRTVKAIAVLMLLLVAACSGDSPTAPPPGGGGPGGGGAQAVTVAIEASNDDPLVNSTSTIIATVTQNGQPAVDGTAVEFSTTLGIFSETGTATTVKITDEGKATVTLTSSQPGSATVRARVGSAVATTGVTFRAQGTGPPPTNGGPTINSISPTTGSPEGGEIITINGTNFQAPVRVLFGNREATVVSVTETEIRVVAPRIDLPLDTQFQEVQITVISGVGTDDEASVTAAQRFRYERQILTPNLFSVTPSSGPNEGNTRVSIIGEGFQAPVRVFFGTGIGVEAAVQQVTFNEIIVLTPPALGLGSALANSEVPIRVTNVASNTSATLSPAFRYGPEMVITGISPGVGSGSGGTEVTIFGWGFDDPVAVTIGGIGAQPIKVSGTEIVAITGAPLPACGGTVSGPTTVTNLEDGNSAEGPEFQFVFVNPSITSISPSSSTAGGTIQITVANPGPGSVRFEIGGQTVIPTAGVQIGPDLFRYSVTVPTNLDFEEEECGVNGTREIPTAFDVTFINVTTTCTDSLPGALTVTPPSTECVEPPVAVVSPTAVAYGDVAVGASADRVVTVSNAGGGTLSVTGASSSNPDYAVTAGPFPASLTAGQSADYTITFTPAAAGASTGTVTFQTSAGAVTVTVSGNGI
ncbi:MAG: IPT/TIG domain-containing protein [Acidobacteria bacterium]|nr:IPT/TIG domain-containing protein [Acidobacteriota bacterium]